MLAKEELLLLVYFIVVVVLLTSFVILFFITYQKRKNKILKEKFEAEKQYEQEIAQSRTEIQEQTLKNVGWELHDNIGQLLSVANMQLNILLRSIEEPAKKPIADIKEVVANSIQEVRALSRSLNNEVIEYVGLEVSVKNELFRFERLNMVQTSFNSSGEKYEIPQKESIILFRILQEFFSNVIKHSKAWDLDVTFSWQPDKFIIEAKDNGIGFITHEVEKSSGLLNMESRAALIKADFNLKSSPGNGTSLTLQLPTKNNSNGQDDNYR